MERTILFKVGIRGVAEIKRMLEVAAIYASGSYPTYAEAIEQTIDCKVCGKTGERPNVQRGDIGGYRLTNDCQRRRVAGVCHTCDFWMEKVAKKNQATVIRTEGRHFMLGAHQFLACLPSQVEGVAKEYSSTKQFKGMGGSKYVVRFADGRVAVTDDLWGQGDIPDLFKHLLPDNATIKEVRR